MRFVRFQSPDEGVATLDRWRDVLRAAHEAPGGQGQFAGVESYLLEITDLTPEQLRGVLERAVGNGDRIMGTAERLRKEGYARGKAEGMAEGKAEGMAEGKAEGMAEGLQEGMREGIQEGIREGKDEGRIEGKALSVLRLIERRFGSPDAATTARVRAADSETLDRWIDRVLDAPTLGAMLGDA
ncbi:MAG: hypothetical protein U1E73_01010 [Planctomycetota bacterium]